MFSLERWTHLCLLCLRACTPLQREILSKELEWHAAHRLHQAFPGHVPGVTCEPNLRFEVR